MKQLLNFCFGFSFLLLQLPSAQAVVADAYDLPKVVAVEPRAYNPHYDITANLGVLPIDAFYKGISYGVSYTHSYSSSWSWEVVNASLSSKADTNLKRDLINSFNVKPTGILDHISWYGLSSVVYTPIYSKNLLFNSRLLYGSFSLVFGGGVIGFSEGDMVPAFGAGTILRMFHSPRYSSKFDIRIYGHTASNKSSDMILMLTYGLSFELGDNSPMEK